MEPAAKRSKKAEAKTPVSDSKKKKTEKVEEEEEEAPPQKKKSAATAVAVAAEVKPAAKKGKASPPAEAKKRGRAEEEEEKKEETKEERLVVASTGIKDEKMLKELGKLAALGAELTEDGRKCNVLVTAGKVLRTVKMLAAICAGRASVVTFDWVKDSLRAGRLVSRHDDKYELRDPETEKKFGFVLREALERARAAPLFAGMVFYCTDNTTPPPDQLRDIIERFEEAMLPFFLFFFAQTFAAVAALCGRRCQPRATPDWW